MPSPLPWISLLLATCLAAQPPAPAPAPAPGPLPPLPNPRGYTVDTIVATVNDSSILLSELRTVAAGTLRELEARRGRLLGSDIEAVLQNELTQLIDKHRLAHSAKSLGTYTPEQIESFYQSELEQDRKDQERDFGSMLSFSEAMKKKRQSWPTYVQEQRIEKMHQLARELAVNYRLAKQQNLFVTPRRLREAYDELRDVRFQVQGAAKVALVVFPDLAMRNEAEQASVTWQLQELRPSQLAEKYPGAISLGEMVAEQLAADLAAVRQFALAGPAQRVSPPLEVQTRLAPNGGFCLAKITEFRAAQNRTFDDPTVQAELRRYCQAKVIRELEDQALQRAYERTEAWRRDAAGGNRPAAR
jgi:hypothetical protein